MSGLVLPLMLFSMSGPSTSAAPTISSLNYEQGDPLGGGQSVIISGSDLGGATTVDFVGTSATIMGNTSSTVTVTLPAKTAGATTVSVTTPGGASNTLAFEFWCPVQISSCTVFAEAPDYSAAGDGTWTPRAGSVFLSLPPGTRRTGGGRSSDALDL